MTESIFRILIPVLLVSFMLHRGYYTKKIQHSAENILEQPKAGTMSQIANILTLFALVVSIMYAIVPDWISWSVLSLPVWMRWAGVLIALGGFGLLQWSQNTLGKSWSAESQFVEGQLLVKNGPYQWVRHPIYTAFLLILGSTLLISASWLVGGLWLGAMGLEIAARVSTEEAMLANQFGDVYHTYVERTGRLLPRIRG